MTPFVFLKKLLESRLTNGAKTWFRAGSEEIANGVSGTRFGAMISEASRHVRGRVALEPSERERAEAGKILKGFDPERWRLLECLRVELVLSRDDLAEESGALAIEEVFRFADEGELCALYRSLALLPDAGRFAWRAGEGCRSNMKSVFEAAALDTPYPFSWFDDVAWGQAVLKAVFVGAPLGRLYGLDERLLPDVARMALDLVDERRSAGRSVQPDLWLCLGPHVDGRALESITRELEPTNPNRAGRAAAAFALARADRRPLLEERQAAEPDPGVQEAMTVALQGDASQASFRATIGPLLETD